LHFINTVSNAKYWLRDAFHHCHEFIIDCFVCLVKSCNRNKMSAKGSFIKEIFIENIHLKFIVKLDLIKHLIAFNCRQFIVMESFLWMKIHVHF
jgi:hypothetical protein